MYKDQHVIPYGGRWAVKGDGNRRPTRVTATRREAIAVAERIARDQGGDVVVHGQDGTIGTLSVYGQLAVSPNGRKASTP
jgi:hypothetical protein